MNKLSSPVVKTPTNAPKINTPSNVTTADTILYPHNLSFCKPPGSITRKKFCQIASIKLKLPVSLSGLKFIKTNTNENTTTVRIIVTASHAIIDTVPLDSVSSNIPCILFFSLILLKESDSFFIALSSYF